MDNIITKEIKMTSVELAEVTGKEHKNVLRDIRNEVTALGEEGQLIFEQSQYVNQLNLEPVNSQEKELI